MWTYKEEITYIKGAKGLIFLHIAETVKLPFYAVQNTFASGGAILDIRNLP